MPRDLLIDGDGRTWDASSSKLRSKLGVFGADLDLTAYAIRNLGYARLRNSVGGAAVRIMFRPRMLTVATLDAVAWALTTGQHTRIVVEPADGSGRTEIIADQADAIARIVYLGDQSGRLARPRYWAQPMSLDRLGTGRLVHLHEMLQAWRVAHGRLDDARAMLRAMTLNCQRFMLASVEAETPVVETIGNGYVIQGQGWVNGAVGLPVYEQPDANYGNCVAESYMKAGRAQEPVLELIDAEIRAPDRVPTRVRYERLLLPWAERGAAFVSSISEVRTSLSAEIADI